MTISCLLKLVVDIFSLHGWFLEHVVVCDIRAELCGFNLLFVEALILLPKIRTGEREESMATYNDSVLMTILDLVIM